MHDIVYTHHTEILQTMHSVSKESVHVYNLFLSKCLFVLHESILSEIVVCVVVMTGVYYFMKGKLTDVSMDASDNLWYRRIGEMAFAICVSVLLIGPTLGAIVSRHIFRRKVTVDWYSVIGGTVLAIGVYHIPLVNVIVLSMVYFSTLLSVLKI